jgi:N-acetylglucosamine kinase-like BadF-type ATPase
MKLFLGVDGGGSSTVALAADETGRVIGEGRGGPSNVSDLPTFAKNLREAVDAAGGVGREFESACFGFSGGIEGKSLVAREIVKAKRYSMVHDASIALTGATAGAPGVVVIAGTGSIAFGKNAQGRTARAGGWGYAFGDEGGAFDIVRQALRAALRFEEGWGRATALHPALIEAAGAGTANDLLHRFYTRAFPRPRIAALATIVDQLARSGDAVAIDILNAAAQSLATLASAVRGQLFQMEESAVVSYSGGVFGSLPLLERFRMLIELDGANRFNVPALRPVEGALIEAFRAAGLDIIPPGVMSR